VMMIAMTPSLKASNRPLPIVTLESMACGFRLESMTCGFRLEAEDHCQVSPSHLTASAKAPAVRRSLGEGEGGSHERTKSAYHPASLL
jgi:hypothetical protein